MTFRSLNIIAILALGILVAIHICWMPIHWAFFLLFAWLYISIVFLACVKLSLGFFMPVVCSAKTTERVVAITFDDGPARYTAAILDTLKQHNVSAAFFCIGKNIPGNEPLLQRIASEGHTIGNHSYSHHYWFDMFGSGKMLADMKQMDNEVARVTGLKPLLFRPPYGVMNPNLARAIKKGGYKPVGWSIRSFDTRAKDKQMLLSRIIGQLKPGSVILLHDSMEITAAILPELIEQIKNKGYKIVPLNKLLNIDAYA